MCLFCSSFGDAPGNFPLFNEDVLSSWAYCTKIREKGHRSFGIGIEKRIYK